jgi:hypothetical protein
MLAWLLPFLRKAWTWQQWVKLPRGSKQVGMQHWPLQLEPYGGGRLHMTVACPLSIPAVELHHTTCWLVNSISLSREPHHTKCLADVSATVQFET